MVIRCLGTKICLCSTLFSALQKYQYSLEYLCHCIKNGFMLLKPFYKCQALNLMHKGITKKLNYFLQMLCDVVSCGVNNMEVLAQV